MLWMGKVLVLVINLEMGKLPRRPMFIPTCLITHGQGSNWAGVILTPFCLH